MSSFVQLREIVGRREVRKWALGKGTPQEMAEVKVLEEKKIRGSSYRSKEAKSS